MLKGNIWVIEWKSKDCRDDLWHPFMKCYVTRKRARHDIKWFTANYPDRTVDLFRIRQYVRKE